MKVIHYLPRFDPKEGGLYSFVTALIRIMAPQGVGAVLCTKDASASSFAYEGANSDLVEIVELNSTAALGLLRSDGFEQWLDAPGCVVHLHGAWYIENVQLARWSAERGVPVVLSTHGMLDDWSLGQSRLKKSLFLRVFRRHFHRNCTIALSTAIGEQRQSMQHLGGTVHRSLPAPVDLTSYRQLPGTELIDRHLKQDFDISPRSGRIRLLYLGRVNPKKRPDVAIDAYKRVTSILPNHRFELMIAGSIDSSYARALVHQCGQSSLLKDVHFLGHIDGEMKRSLIESSDIFILPTLQENFGIAIFEALACGLPVITTKGVDVWPELLDSGAAAVVENTANAFADKIAELTTDPKRLHKMAEVSRPWVLHYLRSDRLAQGYEEVYSEALHLMNARASNRSRS